MRITCVICGVEKPDAEFPDDRRRWNGKATRCRPCKNEINRANYRNAQRKWQKKRREAIKERKQRLGAINHEFYRYRLVKGERDAMRLHQSGLCAICWLRKPLSVDHCHVTGEVRGLLCHNCNVALGHLKDGNFDRAAAYVGATYFVTSHSAQPDHELEAAA